VGVARGALHCLDVGTGEVRWSKDFVEDYGVEPLAWAWDWGFAGAPLVDGERLISLVGAEPDALVVAFDKLTGEELWRALPADLEPGYSQPIIISAGGVQQLIVWHPRAVSALDPVTGAVYWEQPFDVANTLSVATPVHSGERLLVSAFYNGSVMLGLDRDNIGARVLWEGASDNEIQTDGLHALVTTPVILGDHVYGIGSYGQMRCLHAATGERIWETQEVVGERVRWASAQIVRNHDRFFINNDRGELIIARLSPDGYHELSRTHLIEPTSPPGNRRELRAVNWSHPAYANKRIYARNDEQIISASLAAE
jgi:outer membrane protein assembly factor BamB